MQGMQPSLDLSGMMSGFEQNDRRKRRRRRVKGRRFFYFLDPVAGHLLSKGLLTLSPPSPALPSGLSLADLNCMGCGNALF